MKQLKLQKRFWDKMVSGEKKYEIRKLSKGLVEADYELVDYKSLKEDGLEYIDGTFYPGEENLCMQDQKYCKNKYIFGTAHLKPIVINPEFIPLNRGSWIDYEVISFHFIEDVVDGMAMVGLRQIDKETYDFAKEHYIDEGEGFVICEISNVKEGK